MKATNWLIGFDGSCPLGPVLVAPSVVDPHNLDIKAIHNGSVVQDSNTRYVKYSNLAGISHAANS